jgi:hypothetical protein
MSDPQHSEASPEETFEHPKGTLAIVILYGLLFAVGWIVLYVFEFLPRGAPN